MCKYTYISRWTLKALSLFKEKKTHNTIGGKKKKKVPWLYKHLYKLGKFGFLGVVCVCIHAQAFSYLNNWAFCHTPSMQSAYPTIKPPFLSRIPVRCPQLLSSVSTAENTHHKLPGLSLTSWTWGSLTTPHQALHVLNCQQRSQQIKSLLSSRSSSVMASVSFPDSQSFQELHTSTPGIKFNWNYPKDPTWEEGCGPVLKDFVTEMMILKCIIYHQYPDDTNGNLTKHSWITL